MLQALAYRLEGRISHPATIWADAWDLAHELDVGDWHVRAQFTPADAAHAGGIAARKAEAAARNAVRTGRDRWLVERHARVWDHRSKTDPSGS